MKIETFKDLLVDQIKDLYSAEKQLVKALPKMEKAASNPKLKAAFREHCEETKQQVTRLEKISEMLGCKPSGKKCQAMEGLVTEGEEMVNNKNIPSDIRDAGLIAAAQRVEHYEIAGYGTARSFAQRLEEDDVVNALQDTLDEEGAADKKLTEICESIHTADV